RDNANCRYWRAAVIGPHQFGARSSSPARAGLENPSRGPARSDATRPSASPKAPAKPGLRRLGSPPISALPEKPKSAESRAIAPRAPPHHQDPAATSRLWGLREIAADTRWRSLDLPPAKSSKRSAGRDPTESGSGA